MMRKVRSADHTDSVAVMAHTTLAWTRPVLVGEGVCLPRVAPWSLMVCRPLVRALLVARCAVRGAGCIGPLAR